MAVTWTEEQKKVIELRDRNILVAAAAGSGKTAVLVERILSRITDPQDPLDVDELLIVTFTKAAAAQMRERIGQALRERLREEPRNARLQRQLTLLHYAQITTIDSFCLHVLRSHFDELDLDPDFRIGDEGELKLIRGDLIERLMEDLYEEGDPAFWEMVETLAAGKGDEGIGEWIERLFFFVSAYPFPEKTLREWSEDTGTDWLASLFTQLKREAGEWVRQYDRAIRLCLEADGPSAYGEMFESDRRQAEAVRRAEEYDSLQKALTEMSFVRKPVIRDKAVDTKKKERLSAFRDEGKKAQQKWKEQYLFPEKEEMLRQLTESRKPLRTLCRVTEEFCRRFAAYKREKHLVDFNDLEHLALQILITEEDGRIVPSAVAEQLQKTYREVMIDEYQDSNLVQELLLSSVAGHWNGRPNQFMVGDVKQSIYKFRMARPEIFMDKYEAFTTHDSENQKIDLHKNFRSRPQVLEAANFVFRRIMAKPLGGIDYDDASALYPGAVFAAAPEIGEEEDACKEGDVCVKAASVSEEETAGCRDYTTELLLVDLSEEELKKEIDAKEAEAKAIAGRIRRLTDEKEGLRIWDKELNGYRTARFGDIVILLRTFSGWAEPFVNVLLNAGIPAFAQSSSGYFTALEVQTVLNCLRILDNPMQDIPLAAVLHSPIGDFSSREMALLKAEFVKAGSPGDIRGLYGACLYAAGRWKEGTAQADLKGEEQSVRTQRAALCEKTALFLDKISALRSQAVYLPLHELLQRVYDDTGYYELVSVMPDGAVRRANLDMLMERAIAYESTSYYGLFDFVRYIEKLHKYDVDFGEAAPEGENGDTVRITTIHKSKGLEYPIVFVAGLGKAFNRQDTRSRILMHPDLGLAADYVDMENRLRTATLKKRVVAGQLLRDSLGEELRVLYVAMTRAKEKLILCGADKALAKKREKQGLAAGPGEALPSSRVAAAGCYLDWLLLCQQEPKTPIRCEIVPFARLLYEEVERQAGRGNTRETLENWDPRAEYAPEARARMQERLRFTYPGKEEETLPVKLSVSELKHAAMEEDAESCRLVDMENDEEQLPRFLQKEQTAIGGASRGTAYHKVLERLDFASLLRWSETEDRESLERRLKAWREAGILTAAEQEAVSAKKLLQLAKSPSIRRMAKADARGQLYREKPFVMGLPACEVYKERASRELVVIQGIIDVYWQEGDCLYLLDYKTDRVGPEDGEHVLRRRYQAQLDYYARALCQATGLKVRERILYSFALGREIHLEEE